MPSQNVELFARYYPIVPFGLSQGVLEVAKHIISVKLVTRHSPLPPVAAAQMGGYPGGPVLHIGRWSTLVSLGLVRGTSSGISDSSWAWVADVPLLFAGWQAAEFNDTRTVQLTGEIASGLNWWSTDSHVQVDDLGALDALGADSYASLPYPVHPDCLFMHVDQPVVTVNGVLEDKTEAEAQLPDAFVENGYNVAANGSDGVLELRGGPGQGLGRVPMEAVTRPPVGLRSINGMTGDVQIIGAGDIEVSDTLDVSSAIVGERLYRKVTLTITANVPEPEDGTAEEEDPQP